MPTVLKLGHEYFLVEKAADAAAAIKALASAVRLRHTYRKHDGYRDVFWLDPGEIGIINVAASQIVDSDPDKDVEEDAQPPANVIRKPRLLSNG